MAFDFSLMSISLQAMRDMNPISVNYKGVTYEAGRDLLNERLQMSLYGAHNAVDMTVMLVVSELKTIPEKGDKIKIFTPRTGRKGKQMNILGIREDAGGISLRLDCQSRYDDE